MIIMTAVLIILFFTCAVAQVLRSIEKDDCFLAACVIIETVTFVPLLKDYII